jgi:hypothetical protein
MLNGTFNHQQTWNLARNYYVFSPPPPLAKLMKALQFPVKLNAKHLCNSFVAILPSNYESLKYFN